MRPRFAPVIPDYYPLGGGLDLLTPAISMPPGKVISSQNYEPQIGGGYRRIGGYERYSGKDLPSSKSYWIATVVLSDTVAVAATLTGASSGRTGIVLYQPNSTTLILGAVSGDFTPGENIDDGGGVVGTVTSVTSASASTPALHAAYSNLAADLQRLQIATITGSGPIRGIWYYGGYWWAFRDNAGGTAGDMWKATTSGWTQVTFPFEFTFTLGTVAPTVGQTIRGATSGALGVVKAVLLRTGAWDGTGVGSIVYTVTSGTFSSGELIKDNALAVTYCTSSMAGAQVTRLPGGAVTSANRMPGGIDFCNANFTGSTATKRMYGADGVNKAFEFDGTTYVPIRTGMATDTPTHVIAHRGHLFLSFLGSVQYSGIGNPYAYTVVLGTGEIATGEYVTGFQVQSGGATEAALAIYTEGITNILYGVPGATNFQMVASTDDIGAFPFCFQSIGNDGMLLSNRGIQRLKTTLNFGNFEYASVSHLIQPLMTQRRGLQTCSTTLKTRNQYRVWFSDNTAVTVGLTGDKISGAMLLDYGMEVRCVCTAEQDDGTEVTMFGGDDGYVYRDNSGTSFDGEPITAWIRLPFNNLKGPRIRKRYRAAILELVSEGYASLDVTYDLGYGTLDVAQGIAALDQSVLAAGGFWDQFTWDSFTWDSQAVGNPRISLDGIEKNISLLFYNSSDEYNPYTLQGVTLLTSPTRIEK